MKFINYCEEPLFFMKIYNTISEDKKFEFEKKFNEFKEMFDEYNDNKLFNPRIYFKDGRILVIHDDQCVLQVDVREDLQYKYIISETLLEEILYEFNTTHGLWVCDIPENCSERIKFQIDHNNICDEIEEILK